MRLTTTLSLGAATLVLASLCATAQPMRTAAATPAANPAVGPATAPTTATFSPAPAVTTAAPAPAPTTVAAATPAPASSGPIIAESTKNGIAATVGDLSISDFELDQRVALFFATAGFKPTPEDIARARKQQLEQLVDEHIQIAEARKGKITVSPVEVDKILEEFAKRQNVSVKELGESLAKAGSSVDVLRAQQTVAIAWHKVLMARFQDDVVATPAMVDDALRRATEGAGKTHYHVVEIFLPVDNPDKDAEVKKQIEDIETKIRAGAPFRNLAQQFSRNPSAAAGGDMGWIYDGQLDPDLNDALKQMHVNEISHPIKAKGGWYLLGLPERQEALGTTVVQAPPPPSGPPGTLPLARLLLPIAANAPPEALQSTLRAAAQIREAASSCDVLQKLSQDPQLKGTIFMALGDTKLSDVSDKMQKALAGTQSGDVAAPFQDDAGIEIIARCDKRAPPPNVAFKLPTRDEIEGDIFQEQMSAMARRYMRDLRRDANIQERNDNAVVDAALIQ
jgi:peptidyl-prolyl cis-trans isomerase SurA